LLCNFTDAIRILQKRSGLQFTDNETISTFIFSLDPQLATLLAKHHETFPSLEEAIKTVARYENGEKTTAKLFSCLSLKQHVKSQKTGLGIALGNTVSTIDLPSATINQISAPPSASNDRQCFYCHQPGHVI
jgi:hypothetical protein